MLTGIITNCVIEIALAFLFVSKETWVNDRASIQDPVEHLQKTVASLSRAEQELTLKGMGFHRLYIPSDEQNGNSRLVIRRVQMDGTHFRIMDHEIEGNLSKQENVGPNLLTETISDAFFNGGNLITILRERRIERNVDDLQSATNWPSLNDDADHSFNIEVLVEQNASAERKKAAYSVPFFMTGYFDPWPEKPFSQWLNECTVEGCESVEYAGRNCTRLKLLHQRAELTITVIPELDYRIVAVQMVVNGSSVWRGNPMSDYGIEKAVYNDSITEFNDDFSEFVLESEEVTDLLNQNGIRSKEYRNSKSKFSDYRIGATSGWLKELPAIPDGYPVGVVDKMFVEHVWQDGKPVPTWDREREAKLSDLAQLSKRRNDDFPETTADTKSAITFWVVLNGGFCLLVLLIALWVGRRWWLQ